MKTKLLLLLGLFSVVTYSQNALTSITAPSEIARNSNASVTINYVADVAGTYQFQVFPKDAMGQPDFALGGTSIYAGGTLPAAPTGGSFTSSSTDLYCTPSFALGDYVWFIKINVGGGSDITPATYPLVSVVQTLASSSFSIESDEMYVSHDLKSLVVNTTNVASESASVYDMMGKKIISIDNLKEQDSFDFSTIGNGVFVLLTNDNRKLKFVL